MHKMTLLLITAALLLSIQAFASQPVRPDQSHSILVPEFPRTAYTTNTITLPGGTAMEFIWVPPGSFQMGTTAAFPDSPMHTVDITRGFWLGKFELTQEQWNAVMEYNPSHFQGPRRPVEQVTWIDCQTLIARLNKLGTGKFRLPTEAEWEYACRAGTTTEYYWGDDMNHDFCWYTESSDSQTHDVGMKHPNDWGFFDMCGNVCEWVSDWYDANYYKTSPLQDPTGPSQIMKYKVFRGGGWHYFGHNCRSASRGYGTPAHVYSNFGLRILAEQFQGEQ
ncbi:MAG: formylglycine-generating enzyme family protein [Candidatus Wallbacteria bacterium]|nr:formylglycine-generating enzyme family protein [Candidatus Wallbacteria bacterium]